VAERTRGDGVNRRRAPDGRRRHSVRVLLSDGEAQELRRRAIEGNVSVARYLVDAALERLDTPTERRVRMAELDRMERLIRRVAASIDLLAKVADASGKLPAETTAALGDLSAIRQAVWSVARAAGCVDEVDA